MASMFHLSQKTFALQQHVVANGQQHMVMVFAQSITVQAVSTGAIAQSAKPAAKTAAPQIANSMKQLPAPKPQKTDAAVEATAEPKASNKPRWFSPESEITTIDPEAPAKKATSPFAAFLAKGSAKPAQSKQSSDQSDFWNRPSWA